jgi:hypothetical protein
MIRSPISGFSILLAPILIGLYSPFALAEYEIRSGDTLSGLAKSKYGNLEKWKEIWELNKPSIRNPDLIFPGQRLRLLDGESEDLLASAGPSSPTTRSDASGGSSPVKGKKRISEEWRLLPMQSWEKFVFKSNPAIDPDGFDRRSRVAKVIVDKTRATATIANDRIPIQGQIVGARSEFVGISIGDQVFIRQDESLQVGTNYSLTSGPEKVESERDGRVGFIYPIFGTVRIIGVRDGLFIGTLVNMTAKIERGHLLLPEVKPLSIGKPIAANSAIEAQLLSSEADSGNLFGSQQLVFLDAGQADGVKNGMIFRNFLHEDPLSNETLSSKDFIIEAETMVLEAFDRFSVAMVVNCRTPLKTGAKLVSLTDLKDFNRHQGMQTVLQDNAPKSEVNELDRLDSSDGLGEKEKQDLKQLEKWTRPVPSDSLAPAPELEDIQKVDLNPGKKPTTIGQESAPNDGSDKTLPKKEKAESAPETAPETAPEEAAPPKEEELPPAPEVEISKDPEKSEDKPAEKPAEESKSSAAPDASPTPPPSATPAPPADAPVLPPEPEADLPPSPDS